MEGFDLLVKQTVVIADCVTQKTACSDQWLVAIIANRGQSGKR